MADVLLDACCLINLCSSGRLADILRAAPHNWHVCKAVANETLYVAVLIDGRRERTELTLDPWLSDGIIGICEPNDKAELAEYVRHAATVDDGEAMSLALARCRSWMIATDDRKGRRVAAEGGIPTLNTIEIVKAWAEGSRADDAAIRDVVAAIAMLGRYKAPVGATEAAWWRKYAPERGRTIK